MNHRFYFSDRDFPLVFWGEPPRVKPILTVENYLKWYAIYAVHPDGSVEKISCDQWLWDHIPHPAFCESLRHFGYDWHDPSFEMVVGRWETERKTVDYSNQDGEQPFALRYLQSERPLRLQNDRE